MPNRSKQEHEVLINYKTFIATLPKIKDIHNGEWLLLHGGRIVGYHPTLAEAQSVGNKLFNDGIFSVQHVSEEPVRLGT